MKNSISINTGCIKLLFNESGPTPDPDPKITISDIDDGYRTVSFTFKISAGDRWSLSASRGMNDYHESFGNGQSKPGHLGYPAHPELPEKVVEKMSEWLKEEKDKKEKYEKNLFDYYRNSEVQN